MKNAFTRCYWFFFILLMVGACSNEPEYPATPHIELVNLRFNGGTTASPTDALVLNISYTDGDGDLGLTNEVEPPYNDIFYGLANNGNVIEVGKKTVYKELPQFVDVPEGVFGKLITVHTTSDPAYADDLPPFISYSESCVSYHEAAAFVREEDKRIIDDTYAEIDTMRPKAGGPAVFVVHDVFYYRLNPNHINIDVEFWIKDSGGDYHLFDWYKQFCEMTFNQRFPVQSSKSGVLEHEMTSVSLRHVLDGKTLHLKIRIRDRALNLSNEIVTEDFTLDMIKG